MPKVGNMNTFDNAKIYSMILISYVREWISMLVCVLCFKGDNNVKDWILDDKPIENTRCPIYPNPPLGMHPVQGVAHAVFERLQLVLWDRRATNERQ